MASPDLYLDELPDGSPLATSDLLLIERSALEYKVPTTAALAGWSALTPGTGVATALAIAIGSAGAFVVNGGALGTPSSGVATNLTGTAAGLTAGNATLAATVTTNANLTGPITSTGNATAVAAQTGTGSVFAMQASPTFTGTVVAPAIDGSTAANGDITIQGTSNATRTTSYVSLQPNGGNTGVGTATPSYVFHVSRSQNAATNIVVENANAGAAAQTSVAAFNSAGHLYQAGITGGSYTPSGVYLADMAYFNANTAGGVLFTTIGAFPLKFATNETIAVTISGINTGFGGNASPTAKVHPAAGTATANTMPLQFTTGPRETTARIGGYEYDSNHYVTNWKLLRYPLGGPIFDYFADVSVGGAEADIFSSTLLANTFAINGDKVVASYGGNFVTLGTELTQLKAYFAGTAIWDSTGITMASGTSSWRVCVELIRVSSTVVRYVVSLNTSGASGYVYCTSGEVTGLTLTNTAIVKITGTSSGVGSGAGDIVGKMAYGEFKPAYN